VSGAFGLADMAPGDKLPARSHRVEQTTIDRYARVSGDLNPLHIDPAFAAGTAFGKTIAHGMMTLAFVSAAMEAWAGLDWAKAGSIEITFLAPVFPGETVTIAAEVAQPSSDGGISLRLACAADGRSVAAGAAKVALAN
jgi:3-hydroxybutyryl-CoA dehydratase